MQRDAKVTYLGWNNVDLVEGHMLSLLNSDKSRTSAAIYMHENRLYILEGTVPPGYPAPDFFQQSIGWLDENGNGIRYQTLYHHGFPKPPTGRGGAGPDGDRVKAVVAGELVRSISRADSVALSPRVLSSFGSDRRRAPAARHTRPTASQRNRWCASCPATAAGRHGQRLRAPRSQPPQAPSLEAVLHPLVIVTILPPGRLE